MATPRKHWFKVADAIGHETWDNDLLAAAVRLMAHLNTRWARDGLTPEQAGRCSLSRCDVERISGKRRLDVARTLLARLAHVTGTSVEHREDVTLISWPKFAEFQGLTTRESPELRPRVAPSDSVSDSKTQDIGKKKEIPPAAQADPAPVSTSSAPGKTCRLCGIAHGSRGRPFPDKLSDPERARLFAWAQKRQIPEAVVRWYGPRVRRWYDELPSKRARACWVGVLRNAIEQFWFDRDPGNPHTGSAPPRRGTGAGAGRRPPGPNNPELPQMAGPREGLALVPAPQLPASGSDFLREFESRQRVAAVRPAPAAEDEAVRA